VILPGHSPRRGRGFTLLETVVTLVVVSLLVATLMQALNSALGLRTRLLRLQSEARTDYLQEAWFRETVAAAQPDLADAMGAMEGTPESLAYATPLPLVASGMSRVRWWLAPVEGGVALHYADPAVPDLVVVRGPLHDARFSYLDHAGTWVDAWDPPADSPQRLPRLVRFQATTGKGSVLWMVSMLSDPVVLSNIRPDSTRSDGL
jgi:prepilin-type N-terminal cleavage/methylation domain-containing protein